jgi:hypothetical protein
MSTDFHEIFTPGAPPQRHELLVGRELELGRLSSYLMSPGIHPVVVGARGVGKTSLVQEALKDVEITTQIEANTVADFDELARHICDDLGLEIQKVATIIDEHEEGMDAKGKIVVAEGGLSSKRKHIEHLDGMSKSRISPQGLLRLLQGTGVSSVIAIDELDDLDENSDIPIKLAKLAKTLSNQARRVRQKLVFSGIGRDAHDLFSGHLSSQRNLPVVYLAPLTNRHLESFLDRASSALGVLIPAPFRDELVSDASGFPYYLHQVCFHMFDHFNSRHGHTLSPEDFRAGKQRAFEDAFSHYLRKYKGTIYRLELVHHAILFELVRSFKYHYQYAPLEAALARQHDKAVIKKAFRYLLEHEYIAFRKADDTVALHEPLLRPFLRSKLRIRANDKQKDLWDES